MTIRFQCVSCSQPIEVDDELALNVVGCPYCRNTMAAPAESTLVDPDRIPVASPLTPDQGIVTLGQGGSSGDAVAPAQSNPLAMVAFVAACAVLVAIFAGMVIAQGHALELQQLTKDIEQSGSGFSAQLEVTNKFVEEHGGTLPGWFVVMILLQLVSLVGCLVAAVCGLLALRRAARRPYAIAALMISGVCLALSCLGLLVS